MPFLKLADLDFAGCADCRWHKDGEPCSHRTGGQPFVVWDSKKTHAVVCVKYAPKE